MHDLKAFWGKDRAPGKEDSGALEGPGLEPAPQTPPVGLGLLWARGSSTVCREAAGRVMNSDPQNSCGPQTDSESPWISAPASKGGGGGQGTARKAQRDPLGQMVVLKKARNESEVRPIVKSWEPLTRGKWRGTPLGRPCPTSSAPAEGTTGRASPGFLFPTPNTKWGFSADERPALLPPQDTGPAWRHLWERRRLGATGVLSSWRGSRGCRRARAGPLQHPAPSTRPPRHGSEFGPAKQ